MWQFLVLEGAMYVSTCMCWHAAAVRGQCQDLYHEWFKKLFGCVARVVAIRRPGCNRGEVVKIVGGTVLAVAVLRLRVLGLLMRGSSSVVKLLGGRVAIVVVSSRRLMALCSLLLSSDCVLLGLCVRGSCSVVKMIGGRVRSG